MIVFGWNNIKSGTKRPADIKCYNCESVGQMNVYRIIKFWHLFYIPMFPFRIFNEFECIHCKSSLKYNEMGIENRLFYSKYKFKSIPVWSFSGLIIICCFIIFNLYFNMKEKDDLKSKIKANCIGRFCDYKTENKEFSNFKICQKDEDIIYIVYNNYQVSSSSKLSTISEPGYFSKDTIAIELKEIYRMINDNIIYDIHWY